ncbi:MAG TPA: aquaporin [Patescibacteria group bacterium]|nr:aquaporin [Patescibacteria group bacterium]
MKQRYIAELLAEFIGTFVLVMVVLNVSRYGLPFFTAIAAGVAVATFYSVAVKISGGHFNPAVTLGMFSVRKITFVRTIAYLVAQAVGAVAGWQLYDYFTQRSLKNATTSWDWRIFIAEAIGTIVLTVAFAAVIRQKIEGWQAAATIGTAFFLGITVAGLASNGLLNPALALGVRSFDLNYFLGPVLGGIVGFNLYIYALEPIVKGSRFVAAKAAPAPVKRRTAKKSRR